MSGTARSGRPSSTKQTTIRDGSPQAPRTLTASAQKHFDWLIDRLEARDPQSPWRRIDGAALASLAELLESQEQIAHALGERPGDDKLLRLRIQFADRIFKFSGIVGLTPRDRERIPQSNADEHDDIAEWEAES